MTSNIEDTFRPETVNEHLLMQRIRDLRIELLGQPLGFNPFLPENDKVYEVSFPPPLELRLAASVQSGWEDMDLVVRGRSRGKDGASLAFSHYVSREQLNRMGARHAASLLGDAHKNVIRQLTAALSKA